MGWDLPWFTTSDDFSVDFNVGEWHGTNAILREGDRGFRTYFVNERGDEILGSVLELSRHHRAGTAGGVGGLT